MRKIFNDAIMEFKINSKIDVLKLELESIKELSETVGVPSSDVVIELEEKLNHLVELADGSADWVLRMDVLQEEIIASPWK